MNDAAIKLVSDVIGCDPTKISIDDDAQSLDLWDSIAHINIVMRVETELDRLLSTNEIVNISSISGIQKLLSKPH